MITKKVWNAFNELKLVKEESIFYNNYTPSEMAFIFITCILATPLLIVLDLILIPAEVMFYYVKRHYERKLERNDDL